MTHARERERSREKPERQAGHVAAQFEDVRDPVREVLRRATQVQHERLHRLPAFAALAQGTLSPADYAALMRGLHRFHRAFEAVTEPVPGAEPERMPALRPAARAALVALDLRRLGTPIDDEDAAPLPQPRSAAALAGMFYVVDGSMLGAAVLSGPAARIAGAEAAGYWAWCRSNGPGRWRRLCTALPALAEGAEARAEMAGAAVATFTAFAQTFGDDDRLPRTGAA